MVILALENLNHFVKIMNCALIQTLFIYKIELKLQCIYFLIMRQRKKMVQVSEDIQNQIQITDPNYWYAGSLVVWGQAPNKFNTNNIQRQLYIKNEANLTLTLEGDETRISAKFPFDMFFKYIQDVKYVGKIKYFCCVPKNQKNTQQEKEIQKCDEQIKKILTQQEYALKECGPKSRRNMKKREIENRLHEATYLKHQKVKLAKKFIPIRMDLYIGNRIFTQKNGTYSNNLKKLDNMQSLLNTLKANSEQYKNLKTQMNNLIGQQLYKQKLVRSLLLYLMEKANVKVHQRSFVKPPPKLNFLMRQYRRQTIGLITKNQRAQHRIQRKIRQWKRAFQFYGMIHPCIGPLNAKAYKQNYYLSLPANCLIWEERDTSKLGVEMWNFQRLKFQIYHGNILHSEVYPQFHTTMHSTHPISLKGNMKKIMDEIGAYGFGEDDQKGGQDSDTDQDQQDQQTKKTMDISEYKMMKKNETLMERFETQNKYFCKHPTPSNMISQLKPYQCQALQWMKYRQGKITVDELFQEEYKNEVSDFEFERKLSPFWQFVQLVKKQNFYVNYLTGQFTQLFHDWKSIKGGILADQMGLGKTVMTLSLLADEKFEGLNLIVLPVAVLLQWKEQIKKHCGQNVLVYEFHSNSKNRRKINLKQYQIILITYATLGHQYKHYSTNQKEAGQKTIFDYEFQRVILDEAHNIRGTQTLQFNAVMNLKSKYSWCLTGTLIQNSEQDLFAIFKFLRVEVFSEQSWWNQYIKNAGCRQAKLNIIQTVLRPIVLRRTKASTSQKGQAILQLTKKKINIIKPSFTKQQEYIYNKLQQGVKNFFRSNSEAGKSYTHVFQIISKLRQFCCHPALIFGGEDVEEIDEKRIQKMLLNFLQSKGATKNFKQTAVATMLNSEQNCVVCLTPPDEIDAVLTQCGHFYCEPCIKRILNTNPLCPICRMSLTSVSYIKKGDLQMPAQLKNINQSSKVTAILKVIEQIHARGQKCVIFSQWIKIIAILQQKLLQRNIEFGVIMGNMAPQKRQRTIRRFKQKDSCRFLIVSIRAGATGLNLANANNVIICDPWWNPSHEDQAIGRVHRLGQLQDVNVYRFIMKNSIQQKIDKMHESKRVLADQVMMQKGSLTGHKTSATDELIRLLES